MAVNSNIGKITAAIEAGRRAFASIDFGPSIPVNIRENKELFSDFQFNSDQGLFLFGVDKWGDSKLKVDE